MWRDDHDDASRGAAITRRTVLRLMAAAAGGAMGRSGAHAQSAGTSPVMLQRAIPSTKETIPAIGLGTWQTFDVSGTRDPQREVLRRFAEVGGRVVDSSPMYGRAESVVGELATELTLGGKLFVATKVWTSGRDAGIAQMEESMRRLHVKNLDLMQVHNLVDWRTHLATLRGWKQAGRVRYVGMTHYTASAHDELERVLRAEPVDFVQINYSVGEREAERRLLPFARDRGIAVLINRPFAEGALFRAVRGKPIPTWATELGCDSWGQLFLKWILANPAVTCVIPATSKPEHLEDNMKAGLGPLPDAAARDRIAAAVGR
jgi:diketogulonate reductase-like aldo/keto reductase